LFIWMAASGYVASADSWWMIWLFIPITTLLILPDYITPDGMLYPAMDSVAWSLFVEWVAYLVYALGTFRRKTWVLAIAAAGGWVAMTITDFGSGVGWGGGADRSTLLTAGILRCLPAFATGVVIYRIHRHPLFQRLPAISTEILLLAWLCIAILPRPAATPALDAIIVVILSPLLVCLLIRSEHKAPAYCKKLGEVSYPLYVVHPGLIVLATYTPVFGLSHGPHPLNAVLVVVVSIVLAWAIAEILAGARRGPRTLSLRRLRERLSAQSHPAEETRSPALLARH
jgi:peptidoglycan/LPS O-acetylase OafA/YrhL